jgi:hypothetical protein
MLWQYRTMLFEFTKDGLLGDKYVDDEEMEKTLNQLGGQSWELVNVALLQDGVLAFLKRPVESDRLGEIVVETVTATPPQPVIQPQPVAATPKAPSVERAQEVQPPIQGFDWQRKSARRDDESDFIGGIKIS